MLLRIIAVILRSKAAWKNIRVFANQVSQLKESLARIKSLAKDQELLRTGVRPERDQYLFLLVDAVLVTAGQIQAWATVNKDVKLATRFALSRTKLSTAKLELSGIAQEVHTVATENFEALEDLGTTKAALDNLNDLITTYDALAGAPRDAIKNRATVTRILDRELRSAMDLARNFFDPMMRQFETSTPEFFEAYQSARGAFKPGARAKLDENGQPVAKWRQALAAKKEAKPVARTKAKPANAASTPADTVPLAS